MGAVACKQNGCKCEQIRRDCEGNGDVVDETGGEVVDMDLIDQKKVVGEDDMPGEMPRRPPFEVTIVRTGVHWRTLGLLVSPDDNPAYLIVDDIWEPSLVSEWNKANNEDKRVRPGDMITAVNEQQVNGEAMLEIIQGSGKTSSLKLR
eukprot:CAMPEP_0168369314 /NCGR_PEP_ID=MMETSP0228-20121227/6694_1 /TAXON_ID=133427 /ORGANISM="Protoceratium reticulatum, Strain CCCM 535 (=CCMP 1889)" /LENGTH=147 /DNA_ID=CAMNT_0008382171 /DNA_START=9 /DNA_END=448 /DNA_ORIENTATION=-